MIMAEAITTIQMRKNHLHSPLIVLKERTKELKLVSDFQVPHAYACRYMPFSLIIYIVTHIVTLFIASTPPEA